MQEMINLQFAGEDFPAYLVKPHGKPRGGLIVIHEVWGLSDHIKNVAERFAEQGFLVIAPDLLSETDIAEHTTQLRLDLFNPKKRNQAQPKLRALMAPISTPEFATKTVEKLKQCFNFLYNNPEVEQKVAVTGFCFGGTYSFSLAMAEPRLKAAAPFYGHASDKTDELAKINCPVMAFYGENDKALMNALPKLKTDMKTADVSFEAQVYSGAGHAFFNDTNKYAYQSEAAKDAWPKVLKFLNNNL